MKVRISHLKEGLHTIELSGTPEKFDLTGVEFFKNSIFVLLEIDKQRDTLCIRQNIKTIGEFECDRCAEPFSGEIVSEDRVVYTNDREMIKYDDTLRYIAPDQREIDISEDVRDAALLAIPAKKLCEKNCKGICLKCGKNLNKNQCNCTQTISDPRWEALKKLVK
ncbi:MAG: DUF177 domain-containing protein [bacterium]